jgi:hypothetical protein
MNDLIDLKDAWGQPAPPTQAAHTAARAALMRQIAAAHSSAPAALRPRRLGARLGWLTGGVAVAAGVAAVVAFALPIGTARPTRPADPGAGQQVGAGQQSATGQQVGTGQRILLSAAIVADSRPAGTGKYWHLKEVVPDINGVPKTLDTWIAHDGTSYAEPQGSTGVVRLQVGGGFQVGASALTLDQLNALPADPVALKAWITDSYAHSPLAGAAAAADDLPAMVAVTLSSLLWEVPAPPAVRAAAFRLLAAMPNVTSLGQVDGGEALRIALPQPPADKYPGGKVPAGADELKLVIDPATSMLLSTTDYRETDEIRSVEWTNELPRILTSQK